MRCLALLKGLNIAIASADPRRRVYDLTAPSLDAGLFLSLVGGDPAL